MTDIAWQDPFWINFFPNFWANLVADILVGVLLVYLINRIVSLRRQADAEIFALKTNRLGDTRYRVCITGTGEIALREGEVYWQILFKGKMSQIGYSIHKEKSDTSFEGLVIDGIDYCAFGGYMLVPVFHSARVTLIDLGIPDEMDPKNLVIYYFISTPYGLIPKKAKFGDNSVLDLKTGRRSKVIPWGDGEQPFIGIS